MPGQEIRAALTALSFLTRIPVRGPVEADDVTRAGAWFPVVGAGIGVVSGLVARRFGPPLGVAAGAVLTGALHLDALADSADGLGASDPKRVLEIMADSRIGSFGAAALCLDLMVRAEALGRCADPVRASIDAAVLSRAVPVALAAGLPYARSGGGTGQALSLGGWERAGMAAALAVLISRDMGAIAVAGLTGLAAAGFWRRRIGGVTGDALGASLEVCELAVLVWSAR